MLISTNIRSNTCFDVAVLPGIFMYDIFLMILMSYARMI